MKQAIGCMKIISGIFLLVGFLLLAITIQVSASLPINNISVSAIKTDSVTILWDSTFPGTSVIEYGTTTAYGSSTSEDSLAYFHAQTITGLLAGTLYHYRIRSKEWNRTEIISHDYTVTTRTQSELDAVIKAARLDGQLPKTYYVSTTGNNLNDGLSIVTAWRTPSYASTKADVGDTVYVLSGTWTKEYISFSRNGTDIAPITLKAYDSFNIPVLDGVDLTGTVVNLVGRSYVNIDGIFITNYGTPFGMSGENTHHITISNLESSRSQDASYISNGPHHITVLNTSIHGIYSGANSLNIMGYPNGVVHHILVKGSKIYDNTGHNGINIGHSSTIANDYRLDYITVDTTEVYGISQVAVATNNVRVNHLAFTNNYIHSDGRNVGVTTVDSYFGGNEICCGSGYALSSNPASSTPMTTIYDRNYVHDVGAPGTASTGAGDVISDSIYARVTGQDVRISGGTFSLPATILNMKDGTTIYAVNDGQVKYSNGDVFYLISGGDSYAAIYYPNGSMTNVSPSAYTTYTITTYDMTARPVTDSATVSVNKFDTTLSKGSVLVDFSADTTDGNNVDFIIGELKADTNYQVTRAGVNYHVIKSNANKYIAFSNSDWSAKTFTVTETDAPADIITPAYIELGSRINHIDLNGDGTVNILDIVIVAQHFGETTSSPYPSYDINSDGSVDILDIRLVAEGM